MLAGARAANGYGVAVTLVSEPLVLVGLISVVVVPVIIPVSVIEPVPGTVVPTVVPVSVLVLVSAPVPPVPVPVLVSIGKVALVGIVAGVVSPVPVPPVPVEALPQPASANAPARASTLRNAHRFRMIVSPLLFSAGWVRLTHPTSLA